MIWIFLILAACIVADIIMSDKRGRMLEYDEDEFWFDDDEIW